MPQKSFPVIDCDGHVYEPPALWERYLPHEYKALARSTLWHRDNDGLPSTVIVNGRPAPSMHRSRINRFAIWRPGMTPEEIGALDPDGPNPINPCAWDPGRRLKDLDLMGVDRQIVFPTIFAEYLPMVENADMARMLSLAYNGWIKEFCKAAPERLFPVAVLPSQDVAFSIGEARRVAHQGFKAVLLRPCFFQGRFLSHPDYDDLWAELEHLGLVACIHPSPGGANPEWTSTGSFVERVAANLGLGHNMAEAVAPTMDCAMALTAFVLRGHLERFPQLKLMFAHAGVSWVDTALAKAAADLTLRSDVDDVSLEPDRVFFGSPSVATFNTWESSVGRLPDRYGRVACWGSRYPHHDASTAWEAIENLRQWGVPPERVAALMGGNASRTFGIELREESERRG